MVSIHLFTTGSDIPTTDSAIPIIQGTLTIDSIMTDTTEVMPDPATHVVIKVIPGQAPLEVEGQRRPYLELTKIAVVAAAVAKLSKVAQLNAVTMWEEGPKMKI